MRNMCCPDSECKGHNRASFCDMFCRICGKLLVETSQRLADNFSCPKCRASVFPSDNFCGTCGIAIPAKKGEQR